MGEKIAHQKLLLKSSQKLKAGILTGLENYCCLPIWHTQNQSCRCWFKVWMDWLPATFNGHQRYQAISDRGHC